MEPSLPIDCSDSGASLSGMYHELISKRSPVLDVRATNFGLK